MTLHMNEPIQNEDPRLPMKVVGLIPHAGLMCVIEDLVAVFEKSAQAATVIREDSPFLNEDGSVDPTIFIEMIAQTIAAGNGLKLSEEKRIEQEGYLLGVKSMKLLEDAKVGDSLTIKAFTTAQYGDFGIIEGNVFRGDQMLAYGEIKVIQFFKKNSSDAENL